MNFLSCFSGIEAASAAWLPLGLPATDEFWSAPAQPWTSKKAWSGENIKADHAIGE